MARQVITVGFYGSGVPIRSAMGLAPRRSSGSLRRVVKPRGLGGQSQSPAGNPGQLHVPVMAEEVARALNVGPQGGVFVDGTVGSGGHARIILERSSPSGQLIGIDKDPEALARAKQNLSCFKERVVLQRGNYADVRQILNEAGFLEVKGILLDLGASYEQLTSATRGFSFRGCGPLDMRFDPDDPITAHQIVNFWSENELRDLFRSKAQEPWAGRIARAIVRARPIQTTSQLAELVSRAVPPRSTRIHPATRVFQALRMEVNQELSNIARGLEAATRCLEPGGRLCVITYHSLEDKLVKSMMRDKASLQSPFRVITRKPMTPSAEEVKRNPSARSAKLRVLERTQECDAWIKGH
ncbi:MAG: 16S rRNA (cytosine(1402)-N(4))-methyltransferase RsmH [bacterium]